MHPIIQRLTERKLVQWALAYLAGAWFVWEALSMFADRWGVSQSAQRSVDVLLVAGLLATLVLAWYHGEQGRQRIGGLELVLLAALGVGGAAAVRQVGESGGDPGVGASAQPLSRQITFAGNVLNATLSPDGEVLAFVAGEESDTQQLMIQELNRGPPRRVYEAARIYDPQWSPDNVHLTFGTVEDGLASTHILARLGAGDPEVLPSGYVHATWSPDASQLIRWSPKVTDLSVFDLKTRSPTDSLRLSMPVDWLLGVAWSPARDQLALAIVSEGRDGLWTVPLGSKVLRQLIQDSARIRHPVWSQDGESLYYARSPDDRVTEIWRVGVRPDGSPEADPVRVLGPLPIFVRYGIHPPFSVSADMDQLVYVNQLSYSHLTMVELGPASEVRSVTELTSGTASHSTPRLSPDGHQVMFVQSGGVGSHLATLQVTDKSLRQMTFLDGSIWSPAWSASGTHVAFGSNHRGSPGVWTVDLDDGSTREYPDVEYEPANHIAWGSLSGIAYQIPGDQGIRLIEPDTEVGRPLVVRDHEGWIYDVRPSPDGRWLAAWLDGTPGRDHGLWLLAVDGSPRRKLADDHVPIGWAEDGQAVYAMRGPKGGTGRDIDVIHIRGGEPVPYVTLPFVARPWEISMSADGTKIVAAVEDTRTDAWMVDWRRDP